MRLLIAVSTRQCEAPAEEEALAGDQSSVVVEARSRI